MKTREKDDNYVKRFVAKFQCDLLRGFRHLQLTAWRISSCGPIQMDLWR